MAARGPRSNARPGAALYRSSGARRRRHLQRRVSFLRFFSFFFLFFSFSSPLHPSLTHSLTLALIYAKLAREAVLGAKKRKKPEANAGAGPNCPRQEIAVIKHTATFWPDSVTTHGAPPRKKKHLPNFIRSV